MNKTTAIVFFGIILAGLAISLFTLTRCSDRVETTDPPETEEVKVPEEAIEPVPAPQTSKPAPTPEPTETPVAAKPDRPDGTYSTPELLMSAIRDSARNRDVDGFLKTVGPQALTEPTKIELEKLLTDERYIVRPEKPITELAQTPGGKSRWSLHLAPDPKRAAAETKALPPRTINTDLLARKDDQRNDLGVVVEKVTVPAPVTPAAAPMTLTTDGAPVAPQPTSLPALTKEDQSDALTVAYAFSQAVVTQNFEIARQLTDPERVTDERVAALMMALEEGNFSLREEKPLVVTLAKDDLKWILTRIDSTGSYGKSEFAIEMSPDLEAPADSKSWKVHALTFSKLIANLATNAGAGGVAYTPLVENPEGGDSIVLYFEFDTGEVTTRTGRQLKIVADILRGNPDRKININGHADALGSDDYNAALSDERAAAVRRSLLGFGVDPKQVITKAYGESKPIRPNFNEDGTDNPGNRSQNRRAEVYLDF